MGMNYIKQHRFWFMWIAAIAVVGWYWTTDPDGGAETLMRLQWMAWLFVVSGPVYLLRRALMDGAKSRVALGKALETPAGAGMVFLGLCILTGLLFLAFASRASAAGMTVKALPYLPVLQQEVDTYWPDAPGRAVFAGQVEQETCPSLTSKKCWNPRTELKTSREYGFGLGQLTVTSRFDNFAVARGLHPSLRDWQWQDRYSAAKQLRTLVMMNKWNYRRLSFVEDNNERLAMALAAYNGGMGGVLSDRRVCAAVAGCNPNKWFGNVERHSLKAKKAAHGYGKSFFEINREYTRNILGFRRARYAPWFGEV